MGATPRVMLALVVGSGAVWTAGAQSGGAGSWALRVAAVAAAVLSGTRLLTSRELGVALASAAALALSAAGAGLLIESELSLASVPRTGSHQGFVFGSMAADGLSLAEHLGEAAGELDRLARLSPEGKVELTAGWLKHRPKRASAGCRPGPGG